jgi:DNA-binding beta-propeller fold protein YncE
LGVALAALPLFTYGSLADPAWSIGPTVAPTQELAGTIVVVNKSVATARIIDVGSGETLATLPTGDGPHEVVISSDGALAVVTDYGARTGGSTLTVIDIEGLRVERTIDLGEYTRPHGIAFMPGDELLAVTSEASDHVVLVHVGDGEIAKAIPTGHPGSHMLAMVANGERIYTSNGRDNTVSSLSVGPGTHAGSVDVPPQPEAIGVMPDGSEVWVGSNAEGTVSAIDPRSGEVEEVLTGFGWPYRILFTPDQRLVLIPDLRGNELRIVDREERRELAVLSFPGGGPQGITLTGDARYVFQSLSQQGKVVIIDLENHAVVGELEAGPTPDGVAYTDRVVER